MGIKQCTKGTVLWKATGLTLETLQTFGIGNRIDVDGNLLFHQIQGNGGKTTESIIGEMALFLKQIAHCGGFIVTVVIDGEARPDCKRASWDRKKEDSLARINRMYCRFKVLELSTKLEKDAMNEAKRIETQKELQLFNDAASSFEKKSTQVGICSNFCDLLMHRLKSNGSLKMSASGGYVHSKILKARFQSDYVIAARSRQEKNDYIYSTDSDFIALLGDDCILINEMKIQSCNLRKRKRLNTRDQDSILDSTSFSVSISGGSNKKMTELQHQLEQDTNKLNRNAKIIWTKAKRPLFENKPIRLRALIALTLGCDVFEGLKNCGPAKVDKNLVTFTEKNGGKMHSVTNDFELFLVKGLRHMKVNTSKSDINKDTYHSLVHSLVEAFLFEPGIIDKELDMNDNGDNHLPPENISVTLEDNDSQHQYLTDANIAVSH